MRQRLIHTLARGCGSVKGPSLRKYGSSDSPLLHVWRQPQHLGQDQTRDAGLCRAFRGTLGGHGPRVHLRSDVRIPDAATGARGSQGAPSGSGKPDAEKIRAFQAANPETGRQAAWLNARPVPASFAGVDYWAVHAFTLTNAHGEAKLAKLKAVATAGQLGLSDEELKAKPDNFYVDELKERLAKGPASFELIAILGEATDATDDVTATWPEENRKQVKLGTIAITALEPNPTCDAATFDPVVNLPDGVAGPGNDPMFAIRSPAYAISLSRRSQGK
jgi:hypothetical protein